ncbi:helix-turn-helix transcriptional regulator [Ornithinimicrobium faecis]|uniref:WYL domain-containing protein n=1 Tax=Ornithinimicrobium faecis TaxID=2934158 RepID=A0ABY4YPB5_9MICO|nr:MULTISPECIES: WYL domain-containing protein [unclassified Ornithinimicrobium]USQ78198.1 WYL domain-containing protein [Ornithinimicrobium sp. HY1793]
MARPSPASVKTERLLNLVIALLYTRQPMSKSRIRTAVPQYAESSNDAFDRMFERDKDELRDLGIPLRTEVIDPLFDDETGYRIDRREYALPEISFEPDELAVVGVASRAWSQASLAGPAAQALRKLEASGLARDSSSVAGVEPLLHTKEPAFDSARDAVLARRQVTFRYRRGPAGQVTERHLQPWALTSWHGRWYLTGHDLDREAPRVFRLDRVEGTVRATGKPGTYEVPADHDARAMITNSTGDEERDTSVRVALRPGTGHQVRRRGQLLEERGPHDWDIVEVQVGSLWPVIEEVASLGPDAIALAPEELVTGVRQTLESVVARHDLGDPDNNAASTDEIPATVGGEEH